MLHWHRGYTVNNLPSMTLVIFTLKTVMGHSHTHLYIVDLGLSYSYLLLP
jgi:hypothetical protein